MSSVENMVSELEEEYSRITKDFEKYVASLIPIPASTDSHQDELDKLLRAVTGFQTKIEYALEIAEKTAKKTKYFPRLKSVAQGILDRLTSDKVVAKMPLYLVPRTDWLFAPDAPAKGVVPMLRNASHFLIRAEWNYFASACYLAEFVFKTLRTDLPEFEAYMRLVGWLTAFPLDKKVALKNKLRSNGFQEVVVSLEQAESNLEEGYSQEGHRKDCIHQCRDAVENLVANIRVRETGERTVNNFSADIKRLVSSGLYDEETQRLAQGVYSFCSSDRGGHKFEAQKVEIDDCLEAMRETYLLIEILLRKYLSLKKQK